MKNFSKIIIATGLLSMSHLSHAGLLTINVEDAGGLTESQFSLFGQATDLWSSLLTGIQADFDLVMDIEAAGVYIDGEYGVLGSAGPTEATVDSEFSYTYATKGRMEFDTADLDRMESDGSLFDVLIHEMAHVIGFGTFWNTDSFGGPFEGTQSVYQVGSGEYLGEYGLAEYRKEFDPDATFIPVDLTGEEGTKDSHWDEAWAGGSSDLMTGYVQENMTISRTTIASFADIGYETTYTHSSDAVSVDAPASLGLLALGLGAIGFRRRSTTPQKNVL